MAKAKYDNSYTETQVHFYAIGYGYFGLGKDETEARENLKKAGHRGDRILIYRCSPGTDFLSDGSFTSKRDQAEPEIVRKLVKRGNRWTEAPVEQTV